MSNTTMVTLFDDPPSIILNDDTPRVRQSNPVTSHVAADLANLPASQSAVFWALNYFGPLAGFELEQQLTKFSGSRVRSALTELEERGLVARTDDTRLTPWGRPAMVWRVA